MVRNPAETRPPNPRPSQGRHTSPGSLEVSRRSATIREAAVREKLGRLLVTFLTLRRPEHGFMQHTQDGDLGWFRRDSARLDAVDDEVWKSRYPQFACIGGTPWFPRIGVRNKDFDRIEDAPADPRRSGRISRLKP